MLPGASMPFTTATPPTASIEPISSSPAISAAVLDERATPATAEVGAAAMPTDKRAAELWRDVMGRINQSKRMLGAFLEESQFRGISDDGLMIEADDLHATVIEERDNRAIIHSMIREVFGAPIALRCVRPSQPHVQRAAPTNADVQPMIDKAIQFFDGEAVDMTRKPEPPPPPRREWPSRKERPSA